VESAGLALVGVIPEFQRTPSSTYPTHEFGGVWDAYRAAGATLRPVLLGGKTLLITSALPEEGKSITSANLATALARQGNRVVLVDGSLRWPSLRQRAEDTAPALSELLRNPALQPLHALRRTSERGLFLLPGGEPSANPAPLLRSPRLTTVLRELGSAANFVILDGPPIAEGAEAAILAKAADATVLVIQARKSQRSAVRKALKLLSRAGVTPAGAVLNRAAGIPVAPGAVKQELPVATVWTNAPFLPAEPAQDAGRLGLIEPPAQAATAQPAPKLRLIQPYERPLLPFGEKGLVISSEMPRDEDSLEITVDELLVDLEKTLALIRELKQRHANP
jgi:capsular exopolysaccharide synthesis family protein